MHDRVYVQSYPLPLDVAGFVSKVFDEYEYYVVTLNSSLSKARQQEVLAHEIEHIYYGDYESQLTADRLEFNALIRKDSDIAYNEYVEFINDPFFGEMYG